MAWGAQGFSFKWFSEIAPFPSKLLALKYPNIPNVGNMVDIPEMLEHGLIEAPDIICGGTPCQAFSYAGWQKGLKDGRGNLTLNLLILLIPKMRFEANQEKTLNSVLGKCRRRFV